MQQASYPGLWSPEKSMGLVLVYILYHGVTGSCMATGSEFEAQRSAVPRLLDIFVTLGSLQAPAAMDMLGCRALV